MRRAILLSAITLIVVAAAAAETARTPGVYVSLTSTNAAACARACADDGICMAWTFQRDNRCDLSAVVPAALDANALAAGFASRAPAFLQPRAPGIHAEAPDVPVAEPEFVASTNDGAEGGMEAVEDDTALLGGPLEDDLRLGLR